MEPFELMTYVIIGIFTGFFSGMFGIGGGSVRIPLLVMAGMPLVTAFGTNMFAIPFTSSMGAYIQRKNIDWKTVKYFAPGAVLGIIIATFLVGFISDKVLAMIFFAVAIITVLGLYLNKINHHIYERIRPTPENLFGGGFFTNLVIGLRGGSGGTLFTPVLRAMHVGTHNAIATSLFVCIFSSLVALLIYFMRDNILIIPAIVIAVTGMLGSFIGSELSVCTGSRWLKLGLSVVVVVLACSVIYKEFFD